MMSSTGSSVLKLVASVSDLKESSWMLKPEAPGVAMSTVDVLVFWSQCFQASAQVHSRNHSEEKPLRKMFKKPYLCSYTPKPLQLENNKNIQTHSYFFFKSLTLLHWPICRFLELATPGCQTIWQREYHEPSLPNFAVFEGWVCLWKLPCPALYVSFETQLRGRRHQEMESTLLKAPWLLWVTLRGCKRPWGSAPMHRHVLGQFSSSV